MSILEFSDLLEKSRSARSSCTVLNKSNKNRKSTCPLSAKMGKYKLSPVAQWNSPGDVQTISCGSMEQPQRNTNYLLQHNGTALEMYKLSPVAQWNIPLEVQTIFCSTMEQPRSRSDLMFRIFC